jgi:hypothetical protein
MSAPSRTPREVVMSSEDAQLSEFASEPAEPPRGQPLAWQRELDVAIEDIDSRLSHPRRRATDVQPTLPQLGQPEITTETIDEIAWRVAQLLRQDADAVPARGDAVAAAISQTIAAPTPPAAAPYPAARERMPGGIAVSIRVRRPFFRWPFRRRRKRAMITFADSRIT